jgi:hypothetical protein
MARPRKNPDDPKWTPAPESVPISKDDWKMYFCAAFSGLIARGGLSHEQIIKTAKQYADEAIKQL